MTAKKKARRTPGPAWELAVAVEHRREELGLTWPQLRDQYGIEQSVVHRWKTNPRPPMLAKTGMKTADFLDVPLAEVRRLAGINDERPGRKKQPTVTPEQLAELIDQAQGEGWEVIKSRTIRRMAQEDTGQ